MEERRRESRRESRKKVEIGMKMGKGKKRGRKREKQNSRFILKDHCFPLVSNENRIVVCQFYEKQHKHTLL